MSKLPSSKLGKSVAVGFLLAGLLVFWSFSKFNEEGELPIEKTQIEGDSPSDTQLAFKPSPASTSKPVVDSQHSRILWGEADPILAQTLPPELGQPPASSILMEILDTPRNWVIGTSISVLNPVSDQIHHSVVTRMQSDHEGNTTYFAENQPADIPRVQVVSTVSQNATMVFLTIDQESFEFTSFDGIGWFIPTASMGQHIDFAKSDLIEEPLSRYRNLTYLPKKSD